MTLATICENIAVDLGIEELIPPVFSSRTPAARRLVAQARRAMRSLLWRAAWVDLTVEYEFTANGTSEYPLPPDFLRLINDTVWERSRYWAMRGALSPQQWQRYRSSIYGRATIWRRFRVRIPSGKKAGTDAVFSMDPQVGATDHVSQFVYEYQSNTAIRSGIDGTMVGDWVSDDDETVLDEWLVELGTRWRMMRRLGLAYDEEKEEYEREVDKAVARDGGSATLNLVPFYREDFIGQYSLGAFPPVPPFPTGQGPPGWPNQLLMPPEVARAVAPFEVRDWRDETAAPLRPRAPARPQRPPTDRAIARAILASGPPRVPTPPRPTRHWRPGAPVAPIGQAAGAPVEEGPLVTPLGLPGVPEQMPPGT